MRGEPVYVVSIDHRHGTNVTVHATEQGAHAVLKTYALEWWHEFCEGDPPDDPVDAYFEAASGSESYSIDATRIQD